MGQVAIDGELVEFEGEPPLSCRVACDLIEGFLSGQGLMIQSVTLDGDELPLEEVMLRDGYERLDFKSISPQGQLLEMCRKWRSECVELVAEIESTSAVVLRSSWSDGQAAVVSALERLRPLIEGLGVLQGFGEDSAAVWYPSAKETFEKGLASIDRVVDAVQSGDCVLLSDRLAGELAVGWKRVSENLSGAVIPALEEAIGA